MGVGGLSAANGCGPGGNGGLAARGDAATATVEGEWPVGDGDGDSGRGLCPTLPSESRLRSASPLPPASIDDCSPSELPTLVCK